MQTTLARSFFPDGVITDAALREFGKWESSQPSEPATLADFFPRRDRDEKPLIESSELPGWSLYFDGMWDRWFRKHDPLVELNDATLVEDRRTPEDRDRDEWAYNKELGNHSRTQSAKRSHPGFEHARVKGRVHGAAVLQPKTGKYDHWFPKGRVHAIAGASGSGKSTFMLDLLKRQAQGDRVLGHEGAGYTYAVIFFDRGKYDNEETMERLGLDPNDPHYHYLNMSALDASAADAIKYLVESWPEMPDILFVEGADMLISKPAEMQPVMQFLKVLGEVAEHYFISIILSVGSGKNKTGESGYIVQRESIYGTVAWGRKLSGVVCLNYAGDETNKERVLTYSNRNAPAEQYSMTFANGVLIEKAQRPEDVPPLDYWFAEQPEESFTAAEALEGLRETGVSISQPTVYRQLQALIKTGMLAQRKRELPNGKWVWEYRQSRPAPKN